MKAWNPRHCVLDPQKQLIVYYKAEGDASPKGEVSLRNAVLTNSTAKPNAFLVRTAVGEENVFNAAGAAEKERWMKAIADVISPPKKKAAATPTAPAATATPPSASAAVPAPPPPPPGALDPLSYLSDLSVSGAAAPADTAAEQPASASKPKPKPKAAAAKPKKAAAPSFFMSGGGSSSASAAKFPSTGEGLRDAIKAASRSEVDRLLTANPKLCTYSDQQGQTLLHLAAMFGHTSIALRLVEAGADPMAKNPQGETPVDLAPVVLGNKLKKAAS